MKRFTALILLCTIANLGAACGGTNGPSATATEIGSGGASGAAGSATTQGGTGGAATGGTANGGGTAGAVGVMQGGNGGNAVASGGNSAGMGGDGGASGGQANGGAAGGVNLASCGTDNPHAMPLPVIPDKSFDVTKYGAVDGGADNTQAIQAAIAAAAAAGGGTVHVPAGTFLSGPLTLPSSIRLELAAGSILKMLPMASWPGTTPLLSSDGTHDVEVSGAGTIDGQGQPWWNALTATPGLKRPQEIVFTHVARVRITGIKLINPPEEHIWVKNDQDVTVTGITIETLAVAGQHIPNNTDGVDVNATGLFFCGNDIACGDDNVVLSGKKLYVGHCQFGVGHGCSIGSYTDKGVSDVLVDDVTLDGTTSGIRLKSARGRGGLVQNLTYSNITMKNVQTPFWIDSYYPDKPTDPTTDPGQALTATTPVWKDITLKNITVTGSPSAGKLFGLPESKISNVIFDNVQIHSGTGMNIFHATGIVFQGGSTIQNTSGPPVITYDASVTGIATHAYP